MKISSTTIRYILLLVFSFFNLAAFPQSLSDDVKKVYETCLQISTAIKAGNTAGLRTANKQLKECAVSSFTSLRCSDEQPLSLDGHFVFNEEFIDSLIAGRDVYKFAQRYAEPRRGRGSSSSGKVFTKTCGVRKGASSKLRFPSRGHQELAVVTEPGGRVSLRIHDMTHDKWYNDTKDVKQGQPSRHFVFDLPANERSVLEVEVINCGDKDISFVVISN